MKILYLRDYPEAVGETIARHLVCDYTLTGYYIEQGLVWELLYTGDRDTRILEIAVSEYILGKSDKSI